MNRFPTVETIKFGGYDSALNEAEFILFGVPIHQRISGRGALISGPECIRRASMELEEISVRFNVEYDKVRARDIGDVKSLNFKEALESVSRIVDGVRKMRAKPLMIGGEHTFTYSAVTTLKPHTLVVFDAHLDLRKNYLGEELSHATFLRRICEEIPEIKVIHVGSRGVCLEELNYVAKRRVTLMRSIEVIRDLISCLKEFEVELKEAGEIYVSIDLDVLDPPYMSEVSNPEPEGLNTTQILEFLGVLSHFKDEIVGLDVMELAPSLMWHHSHYLAAKLVYELLAALTTNPEARIL